MPSPREFQDAEAIEIRHSNCAFGDSGPPPVSVKFRLQIRFDSRFQHFSMFCHIIDMV